MNIVKKNIQEHLEIISNFSREFHDSIENVANELVSVLSNGGCVYWCGNGGSAADSQHLAAELVGRFKKNRKALCSIALTTDSSVLTCIANDFSYEDVYSRQVEGLIKSRDALIGISTSGNSSNVFNALKEANKIGAKTFGLLGCDGGKIKDLSSLAIVVPSQSTARIQEFHIMVGHILCDLIESGLGLN